jgi:hypothetical protein
MAILHVERIGGLANFGGARSRVRSHGKVDTSALSATEQKAVESLFKSQAGSEPVGTADGFRYRITRTTDGESETVVAPESDVPVAIASCVKDEFV